MQYTNNLKKVRRERGKTQQECADFLGVTRKGYAWYENSERVYFDVIANMAAFLKTDICNLMISRK